LLQNANWAPLNACTFNLDGAEGEQVGPGIFENGQARRDFSENSNAVAMLQEKKNGGLRKKGQTVNKDFTKSYNHPATHLLDCVTEFLQKRRIVYTKKMQENFQGEKRNWL